jgi:hypothetical protein
LGNDKLVVSTLLQKKKKKKKKGKLITSIIFPLTVKKEKEKEKVMQILTQFYQFWIYLPKARKQRKKI